MFSIYYSHFRNSTILYFVCGIFIFFIIPRLYEIPIQFKSSKWRFYIFRTSTSKKLDENINLPIKHVLVAGGAGFIGSHLVDVLMSKGYYVTVLDNISTGTLSNLRQWNNNPKFSFIKHDISIPVFLDYPIHEIYHLASPASPPNYMANPIRTMKANMLGTHNLLGLARRRKAKFFFASTSEVYGDPQIHPQNEEYWGNVNPIGPRSSYDESKRAAEALTLAYHSQEGVDIRIARIFNTYGPRMQPNDGRVVSNFISQALSNQDITMYGDGSNTRSLVYVSDLVDGIWRLMESNYTRPVNLGSDHELSISQLADLIKKLANSSSAIISTPPVVDDPKRRKPLIDLAFRVLLWKPTLSIEGGIQLTIDDFRRNLNVSTTSH